MLELYLPFNKPLQFKPTVRPMRSAV